MAEVLRAREKGAYGDLDYCVEWEDNDGVGRERYFKSRRAAERYALMLETQLLAEALERYVAAQGAAVVQQPHNFDRCLKQNGATRDTRCDSR